ncbi:MAG: hypothetical protein LUE12_02815 [Ruminococcus sp.]|nr:hypothetical protein [Ruminococcus sp.]
MKLNQRDRLILIVILVILVWIVGIFLFIKPAIEDVSSASSELDSLEVELQSLQAQIKEDENLPQDVDDAYEASIELAETFYYQMQQYAAATQVQSLLDVNSDDEQEITNLNMSVSQMTAYTVSQYVFSESVTTTELDNIVAAAEEAAADSDVQVEAATAEISNYTFEFNYQATREDLFTFIENLQTATHRSIVISSLSIADVQENEDDTVYEGSIALDFLMVPELENSADIDNDSETETVDAEAEAEE